MSNKQKVSFLVAVSICVLIGCFSMPIGYYTFIRALVFTSCVMIIYFGKKESVLYNTLFVLIGVFYNPFTPVYLIQKEYWIYLDMILVGLFLQQSWKFWKA